MCRGGAQLKELRVAVMETNQRNLRRLVSMVLIEETQRTNTEQDTDFRNGRSLLSYHHQTGVIREVDSESTYGSFDYSRSNHSLFSFLELPMGELSSNSSEEFITDFDKCFESVCSSFKEEKLIYGLEECFAGLI